MQQKIVPHLLYAKRYISDAHWFIDVLLNNEVQQTFGYYFLDDWSLISGVYYRVDTLSFKKQEPIKNFQIIVYDQHNYFLYNLKYNGKKQLYTKHKRKKSH